MLRLFDPFLFGKSSVWRYFLVLVFLICWLLLYPKGFPTSLVALLLSDGSLRVICRIPGLSGPEPDYESQVNARANQATLGEPLR